jgi:phosphoribosyl 1,2-cyclic phosphate phosphodiesterase
MKRDAEFTFLGTGGSMGVPLVGCQCLVCTSKNVFNRRLRSSGLINVDGKNILIDCGPDFRAQALAANIQYLDGMILTHAHYDHIGGLDDLRAFFVKMNRPIPCLLSTETTHDIKRRFDYMFKEADSKYIILPKIDLEEFKSDRGDILFLGLKLKYLSYSQIGMQVNGIICGNLAYISDIKHFPETIFQDLKGVETLIISALRFTPSAMHFTVDEAIDFSKKFNAKRTYLTHIAHELEHEKANAYLPSNIQMAYDGLKLTFQVE